MKLSSVEAVVQALDQAKVRYIVVGGLAVVLHGYGRSTFDVDIVLELDRANVLSAFAALKPLGYRPLVPITADQFANGEMRKRWISEKGMKVLNLHSDQHLETNIDLFVTEPFDFEAEYRNAFLQELAPGLTLRVASLDTLIAMKRDAGRGKDLVDVDELLKIKGAIRG